MTNWVTAKGNNNNQRYTKEEQKKRGGVEETAPEEALSAVSQQKQRYGTVQSSVLVRLLLSRHLFLSLGTHLIQISHRSFFSFFFFGNLFDSPDFFGTPNWNWNATVCSISKWDAATAAGAETVWQCESRLIVCNRLAENTRFLFIPEINYVLYDMCCTIYSFVCTFRIETSSAIEWLINIHRPLIELCRRLGLDMIFNMTMIG